MNFIIFIVTLFNSKSVDPWLPYFVIGITGLIPLLMIILPIIFFITKTKRNWTFGFRNKLTMSDEKIWEWANKRAMIIMLILGILLLILDISLLIMLFTNKFPWYISMIEPIFAVGLLIIYAVIMHIWTQIRWRNNNVKPLPNELENDESKRQEIDEFWK